MSSTFKKLKVGRGQPLTAAEIVAYVADRQPGGDYYSEAGEALLMWHVTKRAGAVLGIVPPGERAARQEVRRDALEKLISGINPKTGRHIRRPGPDGTSVGAIDLTMSVAPKSVSVVWALGSNQVRYELELMVAKASDRAVLRMLREQPFVRERFNSSSEGVRHVVAEDYVAASALHTTARISANRGVADPQLHLHYLLIGGLDAKDQLRAFDSHTLAKYQAELEAEASGHLAAMLRERGFTIRRQLVQRKNGQPRAAWEIEGVPESLIQAMSSRTSEIAELKKKFTAEYGREPEGRAWEAWIVKQRGPKGRFTASQLRWEWGREAAEHGFGPAAASDLVAAADRRRAAGVAVPSVDDARAREFRGLLLAHVCRDYAFVPESHLDRLAHQLAVRLIPAALVDFVIADMIGDSDLLVTEGDRMITTLEVLGWEQCTLRAVRQLLSQPVSGGVPDHLVDAELKRRAARGQAFDEHQAAAVRVAVSGARFVSITGPAGTGKGVASAAITKLFRDSTISLLRRRGRRVIAAAVPGRTAQQAGVDSGANVALTLDDLRWRLDHGQLELERDDVLLVDEAGMIDHRRYAALLDAVAGAGATLIQIGDDKQLSPVGPGGLWTSTHRQAEAHGTAAELRVVRRAREAGEARAWGAIREGRVVEGLTMIRDAGRLQLYDTREQMREGMVAAWWEAGPERGLMMVDTSNEERDRLNQLAQAKRLAAGELGREAVSFGDGRELHVGDRVLFSGIHRPERPAGRPPVKRVENGTPAVVRGVAGDRRAVELEIEEPAGRRRLWVGAEAPVELGYARHVYKAQGVTVEIAEMAVSLRTRLNELYVMVSRARAGARIHALAAEVEEAAADEAELKAELAADRELKAGRKPAGEPAGEPNWIVPPLEIIREGREPAGASERAPSSEQASPPPAVPQLPSRRRDPLAELERERTRREAVEVATIGEIARRARPSTKEAVGDRPIGLAEPHQAGRQDVGAGRRERTPADDGERDVRHVERWSRTPSLDAKAPKRAAEVAALAAEGKVPERTSPEPWDRPLPASNPVEDAGRYHMARIDTERALAHYQVAGRVTYGADPMAEAIRRLAADPEVVLVLDKEQMESAQASLATDPELRTDVERRGRIVESRAAYRERQQRREQQRSGAEIENGVIQRGIVVANEPWASRHLVRALSVAAESHLVSPPPRAHFAQAVNAREREIREGIARRAAERARSARVRASQRSLRREREHRRTAGRGGVEREPS